MNYKTISKFLPFRHIERLAKEEQPAIEYSSRQVLQIICLGKIFFVLLDLFLQFGEDHHTTHRKASYTTSATTKFLFVSPLEQFHPVAGLLPEIEGLANSLKIFLFGKSRCWLIYLHVLAVDISNCRFLQAGYSGLVTDLTISTREIDISGRG
jgi:hypothetical protein